MDLCPCGTELAYDKCCAPIIKGERDAETAEQLMRSRYSAYALKEIGYLYTSLHPDARKDYDEKSTRKWAESSQWHGLEIIGTSKGGPDDTEGQVEFMAVFTEGGAKREHRELATFAKQSDIWYFVSGEPLKPKQVVNEGPKVGRNDPCPCGSGKKYKKCCAD